MDGIFNDIPIDVECTITREDRNANSFKEIKKLIEYIYDKIKEEIPEASIDMHSLDYTGYRELYISKPIISLNGRSIVIGCFTCSKDHEKPIVPSEMGFTFIPTNEESEFTTNGWITFGRYRNSYDIYYRLVDATIDVFKTFLYTGEIKEHIISTDIL